MKYTNEPAAAAPVPTTSSGPPASSTASTTAASVSIDLLVVLGCLTCWCPCITFGGVAEIVDRGTSSCGTSGALYALLGALTGLFATISQRVAPCCDCCVHFFCEACALCQEYKELKARGFDPDLGWQLSQAAGGAAYPPAPQHMGR